MADSTSPQRLGNVSMQRLFMSRSCALGPISRNVRSSAPQEQHQGAKLMTQPSQSLSQKHGLRYLASSFDFKVSAESPEHSNNGYSITYNIFTHGRLPCLEPENQCPYPHHGLEPEPRCHGLHSEGVLLASDVVRPNHRNALSQADAFCWIGIFTWRKAWKVYEACGEKTCETALKVQILAEIK